jgi:hypothetical protein
MWNDDYYYQLEKEFGANVASKVAQSHRDAIQFIEDVRSAPAMLSNMRIIVMQPFRVQVPFLRDFATLFRLNGSRVDSRL